MRGGAVSSGLQTHCVSNLAVDSETPSTILAGTLEGVFLTMDGGKTWSLSGLAGIPVNAVVVDTATPANAYAGTEGAGAFRMPIVDASGLR